MSSYRERNERTLVRRTLVCHNNTHVVLHDYTVAIKINRTPRRSERSENTRR